MELFDIDFDNLDASFERTANELMNDWVVWSKGTPYRIAELEFYVDNTTHTDSYTHRHHYKKPMANGICMVRE